MKHILLHSSADNAIVNFITVARNVRFLSAHMPKDAYAPPLFCNDALVHAVPNVQQTFLQFVNAVQLRLMHSLLDVTPYLVIRLDYKLDYKLFKSHNHAHLSDTWGILGFTAFCLNFDKIQNGEKRTAHMRFCLFYRHGRDAINCAASNSHSKTSINNRLGRTVLKYDKRQNTKKVNKVAYSRRRQIKI